MTNLLCLQSGCCIGHRVPVLQIAKVLRCLQWQTFGSSRWTQFMLAIGSHHSKPRRRNLVVSLLPCAQSAPATFDSVQCRRKSKKMNSGHRYIWSSILCSPGTAGQIGTEPEIREHVGSALWKESVLKNSMNNRIANSNPRTWYLWIILRSHSLWSLRLPILASIRTMDEQVSFVLDERKLEN